MSGKRTNRDLPIPLINRAKTTDPANIDYNLWLREPELHRRN
jgi:hypothetical protein